MIKITYSSNNDQFKYLKVEGHAEYDEKGKDIVCSAVSAIIFGGLNAIKNLEDYKISNESGLIEISLIKENQNCDDYVVLKTIFIQLKTIEDSYKDYVKISKKK